jgi:hypothetical protein
MSEKLNLLLQKWPSGALVPSIWLRDQGISRQLLKKYSNSGWVESIGPGIYKRPGDEIQWSGVLFTLQSLMALDVHLGGKSVLEINGLAHYIRSDEQNVILWKTPATRLPVWFKRFQFDRQFIIYSTKLFSDTQAGLRKEIVGSQEIWTSCPERAAIEYVHDIPQKESFDEALFIFEGLFSLRSSVLQELLTLCTSIKTKRLFLYLAKETNLPWYSTIDESEIELGKGKRTIHKGGILDTDYQIVVPKINREDR